MKLTKRLAALLLAAVMVFTAIPVYASASDYAITADSFVDVDGKIAIVDYSGTVADVDFTGIKVKSVEYQPDFYFTADAVDAIKAYAAENDYNFLRVHAYALCGNNSFVINNKLYVGAEWRSMDFAISELSTSFKFFSGSETTVEAYLWFEFISKDVINATSFTGADFAFADYEDTVFEREFSGVKAVSAAYQPGFSFTEQAIADIKAYAEKHGFDTLRVTALADLYNNQLKINTSYVGNDWAFVNLFIEDLSTETLFQSLSEGKSTIYLSFTFINRGIVDSDSFEDSHWVNCEDGSVRIQSYTYQPHYYFSQAGIDRIKAYAAANDVDTLRITATYTGTNSLVLNNALWVGNGATRTLDVKIADMTTAFDIWAQGESGVEISLSFTAYKAPAINSTVFSASGWKFENVMDETVDGVTFSGVKATSSDYQPTFYLNEAGVESIKAYAAENGYDTVRFHAYAELYNNCFVINGTKYFAAAWDYYDIPVADLTTSIPFWSQSEGKTTVYLYAEFYKTPLINAASFTGLNGFTNNLDGTVSLTTAVYQPHFYFTAEAVEAIKAYAEANECGTLRITATYTGTNSLVLNNALWIQNGETNSLDVTVADLTTAFDFWDQSETTSAITFSFEFISTHVHNFIASETILPTCTTQGYTVYSCACGESENRDYVEAFGHDYIDHEGEPATCTEAGWTAYQTCSRCDYTTYEAIEALGHDYIDHEAKPASCVEIGWAAYQTCSRCDYTTYEEIEALGHDFVDGKCTRCEAEDPDYEAKDPCEGYTDIDRGSWYHTAADFVIKNGYMGSTKTDALTFEPTTKVSRAMVASIMYRIAGSPAVEYKASFTDVASGKWFTKAIEWAAQNGLASGKGDGKFDPNGNVTRQELAIFMYKLAEYLGQDVSGRADLSKFSDEAKVPSWAKTYVQWAVSAGLISGKGTGDSVKLAPVDNATRAEFASIIMRFLSKNV